jgi:hypothetical protein
LLTSDSLKATVIVILPVLTISANGELELPEVEDVLPEAELPELDAEPVPEPPRLPAVVPEEVLEEEPDDEELPEVLEVDPAETASPAERLASETIVPLVGAYSLVRASAVVALCTLASAL